MNNMSDAELAALVALYNATGGATSWEFETETNHTFDWLSQAPPCRWHKVICDDDGHVVQLHFHFSYLVGTIPSQLGQLSFATLLHFHNNKLSGTLATELGKLSPSLMSLDTADNRISGTIPSQLGRFSRLNSLPLSGNRYSGTIPSELGKLPRLVTLYLDDNLLSGTIPAALGKLTSLETLNLIYNRLSGSIPSQLNRLNDTRLNVLPLCAPPSHRSLPPRHVSPSQTTCEKRVESRSNGARSEPT